MGAEIALRHGAADWVPARFTIDMVRIAPFAPARIETHVVRAGPRMALVDRSYLPPPVQKDVARDACRLSIPCLSSARSLDLGHVLQLPREVSA